MPPFLFNNYGLGLLYKTHQQGGQEHGYCYYHKSRVVAAIKVKDKAPNEWSKSGPNSETHFQSTEYRPNAR